MRSPATLGNPLDSRLSTTLDAFVAARPPGADEDVHMIPAIVDHVVDRCTRPGDLVVDPFAGFGTTLDRAVRTGRRAAGIELMPERVEYMRRQIPDAEILAGDARNLTTLLAQYRQQVSLILASPPYMTITHHDEDPLTAYEVGGGDYRRYLQELSSVAQQCSELLASGGFLVWNVADILHEGDHTPLIDDCTRALTAHLTAVVTVDIDWDTLPHDLTRDALLVFRRSD